MACRDCRRTAWDAGLSGGLAIPGHPEVYVIGDLAGLTIDGVPVPGVAPAAMQEAGHAAKNLLLVLDGKPGLPFRYKNKGSLATIGRSAAVAQLGRVKLSGPLAWLPGCSSTLCP